MRFVGIEETAKTTKGLRNRWGPRVEIRYSVNSENETVEVYGGWYMTDSEFGEWKGEWKYAMTTRRPMSQKAVKRIVRDCIELEQKRRK